MDNRVFLKVKLKSLAEEARIIKREEQKRKIKRDRWSPGDDSLTPHAIDDAKKIRAACAIRRAGRRSRSWYGMSAQQLHELHRHRIDVVRVEARLTAIAYAFIRGRKLKSVDSGAVAFELHSVARAGRYWDRIKAMVKKYGDPERQDVQAWADQALIKGEVGGYSGFAFKQAAAAAG